MEKTLVDRMASERTAERRREKRDILELERTLKAKSISRSATPQSHVTDPTTHSLSSVDEEDEEGLARGVGAAGRCTAVSDSEGAVCEDEEDREADDEGTNGPCGEPDGDMPPAVAAQREFLARLEAKERKRQCCRRCCTCCMPCCKAHCPCCLRCMWPSCPKSRRCWNPCRYSGYFYAALVLACAICGAVFVSCGALQNNRQFLIAGSILCITSFGLFLHRCFRKSPYQPKGYPGFLDEDDFSSVASGDYPAPPPAGVTDIEGGKTVTLTTPGYPADGTPAVTVNCNGRRPSGFEPTQRRASIYDLGQRRRSSVYDGGRRPSSASIAHSLGCVSGDANRRRGRSSGTSGILDLARRLSTAGGTFNEGWQSHGHLRHHYRRSCSYPWAMARPEHHYVEYV